MLVFFITFKYLFLADHVLVNGNTEVAYVPLVKLSPADSNKDYWTYDGRYNDINLITILEYYIVNQYICNGTFIV